MNNPSISTSSTAAIPISQPSNAPFTGQSQASADRAAAAGGPPSRQPSVSGRSGTSTPARPYSEQQAPYQYTTTLPHRPSLSQATSSASQTTLSTAATAGTHSTASPILYSSTVTAPAAYHYTDTASARSELEIVKAENEGLRQRIRSLERALRTRRESAQSDVGGVSGQGTQRDRSESRPGAGGSGGDGGGGSGVGLWAAGTSVAGPRERSESQSTTASSRRGGAVIGEDRDEVVRVGESAGSAGLR